MVTNQTEQYTCLDSNKMPCKLPLKNTNPANDEDSMQYCKIEMPDTQRSNWLWAIFNQSRALLNTGVPPVVWPQPNHLTTLHLSFFMCKKKKKTATCIKLLASGTLLIKCSIKQQSLGTAMEMMDKPMTLTVPITINSDGFYSSSGESRETKVSLLNYNSKQCDSR